MSLEQFERAVVQDSVQYFQYVKGKVVVKYTQEELDSLPPNYHLTGEEYRRNDIYYKKSDIDNVINNGYGIFTLLQVTTIHGINSPFIMCVAFAPKYRITELAQKINISPLGAMVVSTLQYGGNWVSMLLPLHLYKKSNALHDYIMSVYVINTSPLTQKNLARSG